MITHFKGNRSPSISDTISVNNVPFDLNGCTVRFRMRAENSSTLAVDSSAVITNPPGTDGQVHYNWAAPDVSTAGRFLFWWNVTISPGIEQDTQERLITFIDHAPVSRALCTLEDIHSYIPGYLPHSDLATDTILLEMVDAVSTEIHNETNREFIPVVTNPSAKTFELSVFDVAERRLFVGDLMNLNGLSLQVTQTDGTVLGSASAPSTGIVGEPRNRQEWEPYNYLSFPGNLSSSLPLGVGNIVTVTGNWGFPQTPPDIRQAAVKLIINRYLRDVAVGGTAFADAITDADYNLSTAFASAQDTIASYTFYVIA